MIKIDWFSDEVRSQYYSDLKKYLPDKIVWYGDSADPHNPYYIEKELLLCGTRKDVLKRPYIDLYISLRKVIYLYQKKEKEWPAIINLLKKLAITNNSFLIKNYPKYMSCNCVILQSIDALVSEIKNHLDAAMDSIYNNIKNQWRRKKLDSLYGLLTDKQRAWLMNSINVACCPYCNRQYITSLNKEPNKSFRASTADLDHFYNKSIFPLFALSLFNFVPSCQVCNSRVKGQRWLDAVYPYEEGFDDNAVFTVDYSVMPKEKCVKALTSLNPVPVPIKISVTTSDPNKKQHIENSIELFRIPQVYQNHQMYAGELLWKKRLYSDPAYIAALKNTFSSLNHFEITEQNLNLFLYGYRLDKDHQYDKDRPLSKLTYDLGKR